MDSDEWWLPAGTVVKHGTTSNALLNILHEGLVPAGATRAPLRALSEPSVEVEDGIYVGVLLTYFKYTHKSKPCCYLTTIRLRLTQHDNVFYLCDLT